MSFSVRVSKSISLPIDIVFDSVIRSDKLCKYFTSKATADLVEGNTIKWYWEDCEVYHEVKVEQIIKNRQIRFEWDATSNKTEVNFYFDINEDGKTEIKITESQFNYTTTDVKAAMEQTQGWTDFLCSLKAYLHTKINLRTL